MTADAEHEAESQEMPGKLAAEDRLLRACVRRALPGVTGEDLAPLMAKVNWDRLLWLGRNQRTLLWVREALKDRAATELCPAAVRAQLDALAQASQIRGLGHGRELCLLQDRLGGAGIPAICTDGWAFAQVFYGRPELREVGRSISWIVHPGGVEGARELLEADGYEFEAHPLRLNRPNRSLLAFRAGIAPGLAAAEAAEDRLWPPARRVEIGGRRLSTLSPRHWLMHLCWRARAAGMGPVRAFDIATLWLTCPELTQAELLADAGTFGLEAAVIGGVRAALGMFGLPPSEAFEGRTRDRPGAKREPGRSVRTGAVIPRPTPESEIGYLGRFSPTPRPVVLAMLRLAGTGPEDVVYDLGCGDGRLVTLAAKEFGARGVGVDIDPQRISEAEKTVAAAGVEGRVSLRCTDLMAAEVSDATVICLYIQGFAMQDIRAKLERETRPGTRVVSHDFIFPNWPPEKSEIVRGGLHRVSHIYLWRIRPDAPD